MLFNTKRDRQPEDVRTTTDRLQNRSFSVIDHGSTRKGSCVLCWHLVADDSYGQNWLEMIVVNEIDLWGRWKDGVIRSCVVKLWVSFTYFKKTAKPMYLKKEKKIHLYSRAFLINYVYCFCSQIQFGPKNLNTKVIIFTLQLNFKSPNASPTNVTNIWWQVDNINYLQQFSPP